MQFQVTPALSPTSYVTLSKLINLSRPACLLICKKGHKGDTYLREQLGGLRQYLRIIYYNVINRPLLFRCQLEDIEALKRKPAHAALSRVAGQLRTGHDGWRARYLLCTWLTRVQIRPPEKHQ